ncbi:MAG: hypothetical protein K6T86_10880 [Pirellulales bacterium]|nr:hypothetical protein [Pirellulales bacterium]
MPAQPLALSPAAPASGSPLPRGTAPRQLDEGSASGPCRLYNHANPSPAAPAAQASRGEAAPRQLHRLAEVRRREGVSLRCLARRWGISIRVVRQEEQPSTDLPLTALYRWQAALSVPLAELLPDCVAPPVDPVTQRAALVKAMKTAVTIRERARSRRVQRLINSVIDQLVAVMPELAEVGPWQEPGQRPKPKEHGRIISLSQLRSAYRR